jgi:hypothetical protein
VALKLAWFIACVAAFLALYAYLHRRGAPQPVQWGWIAAILGCAAVAMLIGFLV